MLVGGTKCSLNLALAEPFVISVLNASGHELEGFLESHACFGQLTPFNEDAIVPLSPFNVFLKWPWITG